MGGHPVAVAINDQRATSRVRMHFDLVDLRLFVHTAEANSLTGGAERSFLSLPAATTRIKRLEEMIGAKLLYRISHGVTLTPPGQAFAHHARLVLNQLEQPRGGPAGIRARHQGPSAHLREHHRDRRVPAAGAAALPERTSRRQHRSARTRVERHRARRRRRRHRHRHRLRHGASAIHAFLHQRARELHRTVQTRIQVGNFEAACRLVEAGVGVGLLPHSAARRYARRGRSRW
jgi:DNA-binding transcriptional LysR family regulator